MGKDRNINNDNNMISSKEKVEKKMVMRATQNMHEFKVGERIFVMRKAVDFSTSSILSIPLLHFAYQRSKEIHVSEPPLLVILSVVRTLIVSHIVR